MNLLTTKIAKIMYAVPFVIFGGMHLIMGPSFTDMVPSWMLMKIVLVYLTGIAMITAAVCIVIGKQKLVAGLVLGAMLLAYVITIHIPNFMGGQDVTAMPNLLKDLGLAGAAFYFAGSD